jgi:hypothetical protein
MRARTLVVSASALVALGATVLHCVGDAPDVSCERYCKDIAESCGEGASDKATPPMQYKSRTACVAMCGRWDKGDGGVRLGDTIACRLAFASDAKELKVTDPNSPTYALSCFNAGPYGTACVDVQPADACQTFCREVTRHCGVGTSANKTVYSSEDDCTSKCRARFPEVVDGGANDQLAQKFLLTKNEDTLTCRMYHLQNAIENGANSLGAHCPHTNVAVGAPLCGSGTMQDAGAGDAAPEGGADAGADAPSDAPPG